MLSTGQMGKRDLRGASHEQNTAIIMGNLNPICTAIDAPMYQCITVQQASGTGGLLSNDSEHAPSGLVAVSRYREEPVRHEQLQCNLQVDSKQFLPSLASGPIGHIQSKNTKVQLYNLDN